MPFRQTRPWDKCPLPQAHILRQFQSDTLPDSHEIWNLLEFVG
eukprot:COSAG06_NODE_64951_length_258_cov_0.647799_1_plen_42_part_01